MAYEQKLQEINKDETLSETSRADAEAELAREHMGPALRHYVQARDSCPLVSEAQVRLAAYVDFMVRADPPTEYLERAKRLVPADPELWYLAGLHEVLDDHLEKAWASWRRSLEFSPIRFDIILATAAQELQPEELIDKVLPDDPALILRAGLQLYPKKEEHTEERNRYFRRALELIDRTPQGALGAEDLHVKAVIAQAVGEHEQALEAYFAALLRAPDELDWRCELAELLFEMDRIDDCHRELVTVLRQRPNYSRAMRLYKVVTRIRAERM
jgi:tetratricopeptide (TPR) repeat protein